MIKTVKKAHPAPRRAGTIYSRRMFIVGVQGEARDTMSMLQPVRERLDRPIRVPLPWAQLELPDAWPDALDLRRPRDLWRFLTKVLLRRLSRVRLPPDLPLNVALPEYLLLEFHNLPNGNYSKRSRAATAPASTW